MKRTIILINLILLFAGLTAQTRIQIQIPETYELANIILALTDYGRNDKSEVQKDSKYYRDVIAFFEPVKNHPLLQEVNYSRQQWEDYLSFRTDAVAFEFVNNRLRRSFKFFTNRGHKPFDRNIELINDFVIESEFRTFYHNHLAYYDTIIANYSTYYMLDEMMTFLKRECGTTSSKTNDEQYWIVLSPLVGRMNCHRNISKTVTADFPTLASNLINSQARSEIDDAERAIDIHTLFTEADHGFVNPISYKFSKELRTNIDFAKWDNQSGYPGINIFNEYMTWALYDIFISQHFPSLYDSVVVQWHFQNGERGFFASSAFGQKLVELYNNKNPNERLPDLYPKIIAWCNEFQKDISLPRLVFPTDTMKVKEFTDVPIHLKFSEPMRARKTFDINVISLDDERQFTQHLRLTTPQNKIKWSDDGKELEFVLSLDDSAQTVLQMNWWGCKLSLESKKGIGLQVFSKVVLQKRDK